MSMQESDNASEEFSTASELRSYIEGNLENANSDVFAHAGKVDNDQTLEFLNFLSHAYNGEAENMPYRFENTEIGQIMTKSTATRKTNKAVNEGNISQMKFISGKQAYSSDTSGIHTLRKLMNILNKPAYIQYLYGHMGNGKTDFAILEAELSKEELGYEIGTNIKSLEEKDAYLKSYGDLLQWLAQGETVSSIDEIVESDIEVSDKLFIFDEASSHASGYSDDAYETQKKLGTLTKKIRKVGGSMIIIGHTGKDVHPDIRRITNDCVSKVSLKTAEFYHSVEEAKGKGHKFTLSSIPKTNWNSYDTNEITSWDWSEIPSDEKEEMQEKKQEKEESMDKRNMQIVKTVLTNQHPEIEPNEKGEITYGMLADYYDISDGRISQIVSEVADEA